MANTRSGGAHKDGAGDSSAGTSTSKASTAAKAKEPKNARTPTSSTSTSVKQSGSSCSSPNLRRSSRETKGKSTRGSSSMDATPISSAKKQKGVAESTGKASSRRMSNRVKSNSASAPTASDDSNGDSSPLATPNGKKKKQIDVQNPMKNKHDGAESASRPLKKQKRLSAKIYTNLFKTVDEDENAKSPVPVSSPRIDVESASKVHVEGNGPVSGYEESNRQEHDNRAHTNQIVSKFWEAYTAGVSEAANVISDPVSEARTPADPCSQNSTSEFSLSSEARELAAGCSNKSFVPELPSRPNSTIHTEQGNNAVVEGDSFGIQGACTSRQTEVARYDETDCNKHVCVVCENRETQGILKSCDGNGCKRMYHLACLDPRLECVSIGIWLCNMCTRQRLLSGVYSVSEGVESLWDVKEGGQNCKQYFVKYKNLAHVHNRWVPESDLIDTTPGGHDLVSKFSKGIHKEKTLRWKQEWTEPHRLLKKRLLMLPKEAEDFFNSLGDKLPFCNAEWLVKWKDLGYEQATWELETSSFLRTPEGEKLRQNYEKRHVAVKEASDTSKINKVKQSPFEKLQRLPDGFPPGFDNDHLSLLNQLREFWHNSGGAILIDDQERVIKTILFAMSILPDVCRPILIVSTSASLSTWEAKFNRLAPYINVVVYNGEKNVRKTIRDLEFYENGSVMLQVLLSHPDAILEDIETMECISWEAVIVDDCQSSRVSKCLEQLKRICTDFRMALLSSPLKENIPDYINLLSFLNSEGNDTLNTSNGDSVDTSGTLSMLKSRLARHIAFERKVDSSKFWEYWVPARLSRAQLEIYCYTLLSNSPALRSHSRTDSVGALRNILLFLRKCCDHPYLVDQSLPNSLMKGHTVTDILDIGVHASGKLLVLDKMLREIRDKGLRVLILYRADNKSGNTMGEILDDFIRQRFGVEAYERVERGLQVSKKQMAMSMFNDKSKGRFIFLIDSTACLPSIKLSSVDAIIIYSSDWNPTNDLRHLHRINIESQFERLPTFRLYSSCTVEEKALILAKHDHMLDSNSQNITPILSHSLLSWGASFLFSRLEELQNVSSKDSFLKVSRKDSDGDQLMDNILLEFVTNLSTKVEASTNMNCAALSRAHLSGSVYSRNIVLAGEREGISALDDDLPKFLAFWLKLLDGRSPRWQHILPAQRSRRKIQNIEEQGRTPEEIDEFRAKRRKMSKIMDSSPNVGPGKEKDAMLPENNTASSYEMSVDDTWQELGPESLQAAQKGLHLQLKPELSKLCKLLKLPGNVIHLCEELLEYVMKNHRVSQEPKNIVDAFAVALCWRAASLLKHKIDRSNSLALAANHLNYECNEALTEFVYEKLRILKKKFSRRAGEASKHSQSTEVNNISPCKQAASTKFENNESIHNLVTSVEDNLENGSHQEASSDLSIEATVQGDKKMLSVPETHNKEQLPKDVLLNRIMEKSVSLIDMVFSLREQNIRDKQANEVSMLDMHRQKEVIKLREVCKIVVEHLRRNGNDPEGRDGKIKLTIEWFTMLLHAFLDHMRCQLEKLKMQESIVWTKELQLKEKFLQEAKFGQLDNSFDQHIPLPDLDFVMEDFSHFSCCLGAATLQNRPESLDNRAMEITLVRNIIPSEGISVEASRNGPGEVVIHTERELISLSDKRTHKSCDSFDSQGGESLAVQHSLNSSPGIDNSINRESSSGDHGRAEHVGGEGGVAFQTLLGVRGQQLGFAEKEANDRNGNSTLADPSHLAPQIVAAVPSPAALPMLREAETLANLVTPSTQLNVAQEQPLQRKGGQAGLSGVASAQPLQPDLQASTSREIEAQVNHVIQSAQPNVAQAQLPQGEAEQGLSSVASPQTSQPEMQPSTSGVVQTQTNLVTQSAQQSIAPVQLPQGAAEQAGLSDVASTQPLLPEMQPSTPMSNIPPERTNPNWSQSSHQPEDAAGSAQPAQLFPAASMMFNHPPIGDEPLRNELHRLRLYIDSLNKIHEQKQSQLRTECSEEIKKIKQKYDLLIQEQDSVHVEQRKTLDGLCEKVILHQSLADDFRAKFISSSAAQARAHSPPIHPTPHAPQQVPTRPSGVTSTVLPVASPSGGRALVLPARPTPHASQQVPTRPSRVTTAPPAALSSAGRAPVPRHAQPLQVDRPSSSPRSSSPSPQVVRPPLIPGNLVRSAGGPLSHTPRRGSHGVQSEVARAPAPHLQRRSSPRTAPANQQHKNATRLENTSARAQSSPPVTPGPLLPSSSHPTHQVPPVPSVPNPASSSSPQSSEQAPAPSGPSSTTAASAASDALPSRCAGPSTPGTPKSDSGSASFYAWLHKNLGPSNGTPGSSAQREVVCLSDDE